MYSKFLMRHLGIYFMLISSLFFAATGAFGKILSTNLSSVEVVFFRNLIGVLIISYSLIKNRPKQRGGNLPLLLFRAFVGIISLLAFFYNIANIGLAEAFTYAKTAPIFLSVIAFIFLKEKMGKIGWFSVFLGFVGVFFIMQPNLGITKADLMGIMNGFFAALAYASVRGLRKYYEPRIIVFAFVFVGTLVPAMCMLLAEFYTNAKLDFMISKFIMPNFKEFIFIILMGICGIIFQTYLTKSYAASKKAGVASAVSYSDIVFSLFFGLLLGDSLPNVLAWFGIILIVLSGILIAKEK